MADDLTVPRVFYLVGVLVYCHLLFYAGDCPYLLMSICFTHTMGVHTHLQQKQLSRVGGGGDCLNKKKISQIFQTHATMMLSIFLGQINQLEP